MLLPSQQKAVRRWRRRQRANAGRSMALADAITALQRRCARFLERDLRYRLNVPANPLQRMARDCILSLEAASDQARELAKRFSAKR